MYKLALLNPEDLYSDRQVFFMSQDIRYMSHALALAAKARGRTQPNPMVGCVIVRDGVILGEGYHKRAGLPHAEVEALEATGMSTLEGATLYVNLEPCSHQGRTPPCVDLLCKSKPSRIVIAIEDPNPLIKGQGIIRLRESGIEVEVGVLEQEARLLNEVFIKYITTGMPFVTAKCAMTLDGKIATHTGHSRWVTGEDARHRVHELRNTVDGIMVGSRTIMLDDSSLTTRLDCPDKRDPIRIILDGEAYLDRNRRVFHLLSNAPTWVAATEDRGYDFADDVLFLPEGPGGVDMKALMLELGRREISSLLIEGGGTTLASAFESEIVDKVCFFIAPKIIGGRDAVTAVEGEGVAVMDDAIQLTDLRVDRVGEDILVEGYVVKVSPIL